MKLSSRTLSILKNYSVINNSLIIDAGSVLKIVSKEENIVSVATVEENFPVRFGIYQLSDFLIALSLLKEPELEFGKHSVEIKNDDRALEYVYGIDYTRIVQSDILNKNLTVSEAEFEFALSNNQLKEIMKASASLNLTDLSITSLNGVSKIIISNIENPDSNKFSLRLDNVQNKLDNFKYTFKCENLKLLPGDYTIKICPKANRSKATGYFKHETELCYYIAVEDVI